MRAPLLLLLLFLPAACRAPSASPIVLDGRFDDWVGVPAAVVDEADAPEAEVDFRTIRIADEPRLVHVLIDLGRGREINIQRLDGCAKLLLDGDGEPATGRTVHGLPGVDVIISLTPPPERGSDARNTPGMGVGLESTTYEGDPEDETRPPLSPYDIGFALAPTYADRFVELRFERGAELPDTPPFLRGDHFSAKLVLADPAGAVLDETDPFTHAMSPFAPAQPVKNAQQADDPLALAPRSSLRIIAWNMQRGALFKQRDSALRVLRALDPNIICLQELPEDSTAEQVATLLNQIRAGGQTDAPRSAWSVVLGAGGGEKRSAVAARLPVAPDKHLEPILYPGRDDWLLRTAGAIVAHGGRRLIVMSIHLKCCGRIGDESDLRRIVEAKAIRAAVRQAMKAQQADGVIIAGDFNLVGSRTPLDLLTGKIDDEGLALNVAEPMQIDRRSNATWTDRREPFVPGRLDFVLHDKAALQAAGAFVFEARDLAPRWLARYGLRAEDTTISDHLPIVVDLSWRQMPARSSDGEENVH
jgi:endonuclease/exonuclease/phosphatase family metal-dependent hydrolase